MRQVYPRHGKKFTRTRFLSTVLSTVPDSYPQLADRYMLLFHWCFFRGGVELFPRFREATDLKKRQPNHSQECKGVATDRAETELATTPNQGQGCLGLDS